MRSSDPVVTPSERPWIARGRRIEAVTLAAIAVVSGIAAWQALRLGLWNGYEPGPGLFPLAASVLTGSLALAALLATTHSGGEFGLRAGSVEPPGDERRRVVAYVVALVFWACALPWLGFGLASSLALCGILRFAERQAWRLVVALALSAVALGWLVFERLLGVPLPHGPGLPF